MQNFNYGFRVLEKPETSTADQEGDKTYEWDIKPQGKVGTVVRAGNGLNVKILCVEGTSGLGKTRMIDVLSGHKKVKPVCLDFFEFIRTRSAEEKEILNWTIKSSDPLMACFYNDCLNHKMNEVIQNLPPGVEVVVSDRYKLSDIIYNLLFSFVKVGDKNLPTEDIVKKFKARWEKYIGYTCKNYTRDLESYVIAIDSRSDEVLKRITDRNTPLDRAFIKIFENYPEVQSIIWAYVAKYLGLPLIDMRGGFISSNIKNILIDCGFEL